MNAKTKRRLLSGVLTFSMLASLLPVGVAPAKAEEISEGTAKMFNQDAVAPVDFEKMKESDPYGLQLGEEKILTEQKEIMVSASSHWYDDGPLKLKYNIFDTYKDDKISER